MVILFPIRTQVQNSRNDGMKKTEFVMSFLLERLTGYG